MYLMFNFWIGIPSLSIAHTVIQMDFIIFIYFDHTHVHVVVKAV